MDEITYITGWDRGIKYLADVGLLENAVLMLTGSDMIIIRESRMQFPGRRGQSDTCDFHLYPLSFYEYVKLKSYFTVEELNFIKTSDVEPATVQITRLLEALENYLAHGGFLTAINDIARHQYILPATFTTYSDWIRGDILKRNK